MDNKVTLYTTRFCPYCMRARGLLDSKGVQYTDIAVDGEPQLRQEMMQRSGQHTVPQIWIGEQHVGGFDDMARLEQQGQLDELLETTP
jgi:glutaredoxin 3